MKPGSFRILWTGGWPESGCRTGDGQLFSNRAVPADRKTFHVDVLEKVSFHELVQIFLPAHRVPFGAGTFRNHQLTGLIGANNHIPAVFGQPLICHNPILGQRILLSKFQCPFGRYPLRRKAPEKEF
jgi:hypothetical protein